MTEHDLRHLLDTAAADADRERLTAAVVIGAAESRSRRKRTALAASVAVAAIATVAAVGVATRPWSSDLDAPGEPSALCALEVRFNGEVYDGAPRGNPERAPELTGRTATAHLPACNDTGETDESPQRLTVEEIEGLPMTTALWAQGDLLVRRGETLPAFTDAWYRKPSCTRSEPFHVVGQWVGVMTEKKVRFDGDLRPPLYVDLRVEPGHGSPRDLERYTFRIHDDGDASPGLDPHMAEEALWSSRAALDVTVACDGDRFVAQAFALRPRE